MDVKSPQNGAGARFALSIEKALNHLHQFTEVVNTKAKPKLREWKRLIIRSADPVFPTECLGSGRGIAAELLEHIRSARQLVTDEFSGELPLWASSLSEVDQQIQNWIGSIDGPCANMPILVIEGYEFLTDCADWLANPRVRLSDEVRDTRVIAEPSLPVQTIPFVKEKKKPGRPRLTEDNDELSIAFEIERYFESQGCTWEEAIETVCRYRGKKKLRVSTVKSRLRRARENPSAKVRIA